MGKILELTREQYDAHPGMNWSRLKHLLDSPAHFLHRLEHKEEDTDAMRIGRALHVEVLEFGQPNAAVWRGGRRQGKEWEAFKEANAGRDILTEDQRADVEGMAASILRNKEASAMLQAARTEVAIEWGSEGWPLKSRLDGVGPFGILDVKTTTDASPDGFAAESWRCHYHVQAAMYRRAWASANDDIGSLGLSYFLVAVEKSAPYVCQVYRMDDQSLNEGAVRLNMLLEAHEKCRAAKSWPGYSDGALVLRAPRWAALDVATIGTAP